MGEDKGLLHVRGKELAALVADNLTGIASQITIISNNPVYKRLGFDVVEDSIKGCGPLSGLITAAEHTSTPWFFVVACDMPEADPALLNELLEYADNSLAVVPYHDEIYEPLCALYHRDSLKVLKQCASEDRLKLQDVVKQLNAYPFVTDANASYKFYNINYKSQLEGFE